MCGAFLLPYRHGVCRTQVVDRRMVDESDIYASEEQRLSDDALCEEVLDKVLLHRSCLVRKLCQPSAYGCNPDKVQHRHHALCGFTSHLKPRQCSCCCTCCRALAVVLLLLYSCCFALREDVMMYGQKAFRMWAL